MAKRNTYNFKIVFILSILITCFSFVYHQKFNYNYRYAGCDFSSCYEPIGGIELRAAGFPISYFVFGTYNKEGKIVSTFDANCISGNCVRSLEGEINGNNGSISPRPTPIDDANVYNDAGIGSEKGFHLIPFLLDLLFWFIFVGIIYTIVFYCFRIFSIYTNLVTKKQR